MRAEAFDPVIRVLVADDTRIHTQLLADALRRDGVLEVISSDSDSQGLIVRADLPNIDVLLLGSNLDEQPARGFEVLREVHALHANVRAVILLDSSKPETILTAFRAGARGVFSKKESVETLGKCVRRVHQGQIWADSHQMGLVLQALASSHNPCAVNAHGVNLLSKREMEVVRSVAQGLTNREIAERLGLSQHTVKNYLFRVFDKLGVSSRVELLFMTLSRDHHTRGGPQGLLASRPESFFPDEATLAAYQKAAEQGVLMAQLALAQFYSARSASPDDLVQAHIWHSVVGEQLLRASKDAAKRMTVDQLLQAEQMAATLMNRPKKVCSVKTNVSSVGARETSRLRVNAGAGSEQLAVEAVGQGSEVVSTGLLDHSFTYPKDSPALDLRHNGAVLLPLPRKAKMSHGHAAQFFSDDASFLTGFANFIEPALKAGNAVIVAATESHHKGLLQRLQAQGLSVGAAIEQGSYVPLVAAEMLSSFMANDLLDPVRFLKVVGDLVAAAAKGPKGEHRRVAACGECAPILWAQGNTDAAIQLEHLWEEIAKTCNVDILCGYVLKDLELEQGGHIYEKICAQHSAVCSRPPTMGQTEVGD